MTLHDAVSTQLANVEQRYTKNRRELVELLDSSSRPLSMPEILKKLPTSAQSSVYRNLTVLEDSNVVRKVVGNNQSVRYELVEELTQHHHHLICTNCGKVLDHELSSEVEQSLEKIAQKIEKDSGFLADTHRMDLVGFCSECRKKNG